MIRLVLSYSLVGGRVSYDILVHYRSDFVQRFGIHSIAPSSDHLLTIFAAIDLPLQNPIQVIVVFESLDVCSSFR